MEPLDPRLDIHMIGVFCHQQRQQIQAPAEEVQVCLVFSVGFVGILGERGAAHAIGGIADDKAQLAAHLRFVVNQPALQRPFIDGQVGTYGGEQPRRHLRELDRGPCERLKPRSRARMDQAPDAGRRLQRLNPAVLVRQSG